MAVDVHAACKWHARVRAEVDALMALVGSNEYSTARTAVYDTLPDSDWREALIDEIEQRETDEAEWAMELAAGRV